MRCGSCDAEIEWDPEDTIESNPENRRQVVSHCFNDPATPDYSSTKTYYCDPQCFIDAVKDGKVRRIEEVDKQ